MSSETLTFAPGLGLDLYTIQGSEERPLFVFVHGGAWRAEDKADHVGLANRIAQATGCAVAVPNYTLCPRIPGVGPEVHHPRHAQDVLRALEFLHGHTAPQTYNHNKIFVMGHSCGAHILATMLVKTPEAELVPSDSLLQAVLGVITTEAIFDLDLLLKDFPPYGGWFIEAAFGKKDDYRNSSATGFEERKRLAWLLIQSKGDTLVNIAQARSMYDSILRHRENEPSPTAGLETEWESFEEEHDDVLGNPQLAERIRVFVDTHSS